MSRHRLPTLAIVLFAVLTLSAQEERVEVRLVEIEARVTDRQGRPVDDLRRDELTLKEDGVPHDIATLHYVPSEMLVPDPASTADVPTPPVAAPDLLPASATWLYIAAEVGSAEFTRAYEAIRPVFERPLPRGMKVSIGGLPFTAERQTLLSILESIRFGPYGDGRTTALIDTARAQHQDVENERALAAELRAQEEGFATLQGFVNRPEQVERSAAQARPFLTEGRIDRQLPLFGDVALYRYLDLIDRLGSLPGKKIVVLFRPGLRVESDNALLMQQVAGAAVRRRVSFFTVDSRGLDPLIPNEGQPVPMPDDRRRRQASDNVIAREMQTLSEEGLASLARETGGKAVLGTNSLHEVFRAALDAARGFYVLGYYPVDLSANGRYRRLRVQTTRSDVKVDATRGYYEPRAGNPFGGADKALKLRRALLGPIPRDIGVATTVGIFAGDDGSPFLVLSAGMPASTLVSSEGKRREALAATALVRIADVTGTQLPIYFERKLLSRADDELRRRAPRDTSLFLSMSDVMPLPPGRYEWRVVFRDDESGRMGGSEGHVDVPDLTGTSTPSTLLITREVVITSESAPADPQHGDRSPLEAGKLRFIPQPSRVFRQGDTIHLLYHLYNATPADFEAAARGTQLGLLRAGEPVSRVEAFGEPFVDREHGIIRFAASIRTRSLDPGQYLVFVVLPNHQHRKQQHLAAPFVLLPT